MTDTTRAGQPTSLRDLVSDEITRLEAMDPAARQEAVRAARAQPEPIKPAARRGETYPPAPERFGAATLDNYQAETPEEQKALRAVRRWVEIAAEGRGAMLALIGSTGIGKSHLLHGAAHALRALGVGHYSRPWYRLADELRYGMQTPDAATTADATTEPAQVRTRLWTHRRVVLLDEVTATSGTDFDRLELHKFIHHAYDQCMAVLITSPTNPLQDLVGSQAASRFVEIVLSGRDRRKS